MRFIFACICVVFASASWAQDSTEVRSASTQTVLGQLLDKQSKLPIKQGRIELLNYMPIKYAVVRDSLGNFELQGVPLGRHRLLVTAPKYQEMFVYDVIVTAGKQTTLHVEMEEMSGKDNGGEDSPKENKRQPVTLYIKSSSINTLNSVAIQPFTLDEVNRFAGSRGDIARLVTASAGTINSDDGRNDIIARGATPLGIQWRVEGMPVINPNHFGHLSTTAGFLPILNINNTANSEFMFANFSAEYGNSTAGVFDINFRNGTRNRTEVTAQIGLFNGAELVIEGPLSRTRKRGSYIIAGRMGLLKALLSDIASGTSTTTYPSYNDVNFKIDFGRTHKQEWSMFGYYGAGNILYDHNKVAEDDLILADGNKDQRSATTFGTIGVRNRYFISRRSYLQTTLGNSFARERENSVFYYTASDSSQQSYDGVDFTFINNNTVLSSVLNTKFTSSYTMRNGIMAEAQYANLKEMYNWDNTTPFERYNYNGVSVLTTLFHQSQFKYKLATFQLGVNMMHYSLNNTVGIDPRVAWAQQIGKHQILNVGYSLQHQQLPQRIYFAQRPLSGTGILDNTTIGRDLQMMANHYFTIEYKWKPNDLWTFSLMPYYRYWFNIPVAADAPTGYSMYNSYSNLFDEVPNFQLKSSGTAKNYGVDAAAHRVFENGFYCIISGSYFKSTYKGSDGIERNSRFNRRFIARVRAGQEWKMGKLRNNLFFLNTTFTYAGGQYYTPIDLVASQLANKQELTHDWFSATTPNYMRWDIKIGARFNSRKRRISHYVYLDIMNVLATNNVLEYRYSQTKGNIIPVPQSGLLPDVLYRLQF